MNIGEWHSNPNFKMVWSINNRASYDAYDELADSICKAAIAKGLSDLTDADEQLLRDGYDLIELDFTAPEGTPDGVHRVREKYVHGPKQPVVHGVEVRDGRFVIEPTEDAVLRLVCAEYEVTADSVRSGEEGIDHVYIERFFWNAEENLLEVSIGS